MSGITQSLIASLNFPQAFTFVGGKAGSNSASQTPSVSLTSLSGGASTSPQIGDMVIVAITFNEGTNRDISCTTSGYTEIADLHSIDIGSSQLGVYYKILSEEETTVDFDLGVSVASSFIVYVWRNFNSTQFDASATTATGGDPPNPPSITTVSQNALIIAIGSIGVNSSFDELGAPTINTVEMGNFFSNNVQSSRAIGVASLVVGAPANYNPSTFSGGDTAFGSACAVTIALRPK